MTSSSVATTAAPATHTNASVVERRRAATPNGLGMIHPIAAASGRGHLLIDVEGREYIDFCGGIGVINVGHCHPRVVEAVKAQAEKLIHSCFHVAINENYVRLAERLNDLVPINGECKTAFANSGAEAGENAIKISRVFTKRHGVVCFERGFHGRTLLGMTLTGKPNPYSMGMGPFAPEVYRLPYAPFFANPRRTSDAEVEAACKKALDNLFSYHIEPQGVACVIIEPVFGEGGFLPAHPVGMRLLREACAQHGIVFISDEVQTGFGRCGSLFAIERYGLEPDMIAMAKSLGGGMPLSAVTARKEIMDSVHAGGIGGTYGGNPLACAAALAVLDIMEDERLPSRAQQIGDKVLACFRELEKQYDFVSDSRGLGAMCGIEFSKPGTSEPDADRALAVCTAARERGLLLMRASLNVVRTLMPLTIPDAELDRALDIFRASVKAVV